MEAGIPTTASVLLSQRAVSGITWTIPVFTTKTKVTYQHKLHIRSF